MQCGLTDATGEPLRIWYFARVSVLWNMLLSELEEGTLGM